MHLKSFIQNVSQTKTKQYVYRLPVCHKFYTELHYECVSAGKISEWEYQSEREVTGKNSFCFLHLEMIGIIVHIYFSRRNFLEIITSRNYSVMFASQHSQNCHIMGAVKNISKPPPRLILLVQLHVVICRMCYSNVVYSLLVLGSQLPSLLNLAVLHSHLLLPQHAEST